MQFLGTHLLATSTQRIRTLGRRSPCVPILYGSRGASFSSTSAYAGKVKTDRNNSKLTTIKEPMKKVTLNSRRSLEQLVPEERKTYYLLMKDRPLKPSYDHFNYNDYVYEDMHKLLPPVPDRYKKDSEKAKVFTRFPHYFINRSSVGKNLPIYVERKFRDMKVRTEIRHVSGDCWEFARELAIILELKRPMDSEDELRARLGSREGLNVKKKALRTRNYISVRQDLGQVVLRGDHVQTVKRFLLERGF